MDLVFRLSALGSVCLLCGRIQNPVTESSAFQASGSYLYTTVQREVNGVSGVAAGPGVFALGDAADSTPHGVGIGISWVKAAGQGLGVGTPALEVTVGIVDATSHTEADTRDGSGLSAFNGSGNGRFETFWGLGRIPIGERHSAELAIEFPFNRSRDLLVSGPDNLYGNPERRNLYAYTANVALGYRYRGEGWEGAAGLRWAYPSLQNGTYFSYTNGTGPVWGFETEVLRRFGQWRASLSGGTQRGTLHFEQGLFPEFRPETFSRRLVRDFLRLQAARPVAGITAIASVHWVGLSTPYWDSAATLNTETFLHDLGMDYHFRSDELFLTVGVDIPIRELFSIQLAAMKRFGWEDVDLTPTSTNPGRGTLTVSRTGWGVTGGFCTTVR
jgi:hypothetical protein